MIKQAGFQKIISILLITNLIGCTSLQPIEAQPDELQDRIRYEQIVAVGDRVRMVTEDGKQHQFKVTSIDANHISGDDVTIPVDTVIALETREISIGKTTLLAGGITGTMLLIFIAIAPAAILAASAP
jgi:hypothetical protein